MFRSFASRANTKPHFVTIASAISASVALVVLLHASSASAAFLIGSVELYTTTTQVDLTAIGTTDWAYWNTSANPAAAAPTNRKLGGTLISGISAVGGGGIRGSGATTRPVTRFNATDGTSPTTVSNLDASGLFNTQLATSGAGVQVSVLLPDELSTYYISLWVGAFTQENPLATNTLTATLPGAAAYVDSSLVTPVSGSTKHVARYSFVVTPDNANDVFTMSYVMSQAGGTNSHVLIAGVAVEVVPVPEPATLPLLLVGAALVGVASRRRKVARPAA